MQQTLFDLIPSIPTGRKPTARQRPPKHPDENLDHVHSGGLVDIPFPRAVRDALLDEGLAEEHRWVPNSGWISFQMHTEQNVRHALWLMRLSYLRYALKTAADARTLFEQQAAALHLSVRFRSLLEKFMPANANEFVAQAQQS